MYSFILSITDTMKDISGVFSLFSGVGTHIEIASSSLTTLKFEVARNCSFFTALASSLSELKNEIDFFKGPFKDMGYGIQRTDSGQYYHWHVDGGSHDFSNRQLVAIFYLNEVKEKQGGTTDFLYQGVNITPETGKLILFPPFWTHKHRGAKVISGQKYIATTWVVFA